MCCRVLLKYTLFTINLIFTLIGIAIVALGVIFHFTLDNLQSADTPAVFFTFVPYVVIAIGAFVFLIAFCGCCGSISEIKCLLITFAVFMAVFAAVQIYAIVMLFIHGNKIQDTVEIALNDAFENIESNPTFHGLEVLLKCCGTTGPYSYNATFAGSDILNDTNIDIVDLIHQGYLPPSCCDNFTGSITENFTEITTCKQEDAFQRGCNNVIKENLQKVIRIMSIVLISVTVYELLAMASAIYISCKKKSRYA